MFILNGKPLSPDRAFTTPDGTQYASNWLRLSTPEQRAAIGITEQPDLPTWNQEYYWGYDENGDLIPKDLEQLKELHIQRVKQTANGNLQPTDWYVVRKFERNIDIPTNVVEYRTSVVSIAEQRETLISSVTTVQELENLNLPDWPTL